ncbi:MAG: hypothetical protein E7374_01090 [Clostridiales bacterium]|nr:hypothetical protein [Clostridiales bacterium]
MKLKKINCIIDSDPGVDDTAAITLSLYDDVMDIKLISTVSGNLDIDAVTRNMAHVLKMFKRTDIPFVKGSARPMIREPKDAKFIHQNEGMGNYIPPKKVSYKPMDKDAIEAMYETICANKNDISIVVLGPMTNVGYLIQRHPDVTGMIDRIYTEGCAPYGWKHEGKWSNYISFNASSDPEALKIVLESGIPITYIRSRIGREITNWNEEEVLSMKDINDVGRFIYEMYSGYWEPGYDDRRIATNDTCAVLALRFPELFKTKKVKLTVNTDDMPGRTDVVFDKKGNVDFVVKVNAKKVHKYFFNAIKKLDFIKIYK